MAQPLSPSIWMYTYGTDVNMIIEWPLIVQEADDRSGSSNDTDLSGADSFFKLSRRSRFSMYVARRKTQLIQFAGFSRDLVRWLWLLSPRLTSSSRPTGSRR